MSDRIYPECTHGFAQPTNCRICMERDSAKANLGLATTKQLLDEIQSRIAFDWYNGGGGLGYTTAFGRAKASDPNPLPRVEPWHTVVHTYDGKTEYYNLDNPCDDMDCPACHPKTDIDSLTFKQMMKARRKELKKRAKSFYDSRENWFEANK